MKSETDRSNLCFQTMRIIISSFPQIAILLRTIRSRFRIIHHRKTAYRLISRRFSLSDVLKSIPQSPSSSLISRPIEKIFAPHAARRLSFSTSFAFPFPRRLIKSGIVGNAPRFTHSLTPLNRGSS